MSTTTLDEVQRLQFSDREAAGEALLKFFRTYLPFQIETLQVRPLAVSLNSINGLFTLRDGRRMFFKTHVEPQSVINEFYNSTILSEAGYQVLRPVYEVTEPGKQVLIYEYIEIPSLFDVLHDLENFEDFEGLESGRPRGPAGMTEEAARRKAEGVIAIQSAADLELLEIYRATLGYSSAAEHAAAPIHQLFYHRLTGGRLETFYRGRELALPGRTAGSEQSVSFEQLKGWSWNINGRRYEHTLEELLERAIVRLDPARADTPSVVGHGDAHNGNLFLDERHGRLLYFDPAFAGRHSPLLDLTKPLFHNVFADWLYFPEDAARALSIGLEIRDGTVFVRHDFAPSDIRIAIFRSKVNLVLKPLLQDLRLRGWLSPEWKTDLKLALFCCPFLTMNLSDRRKFPPAISLLGLALSIEMGSRSVTGAAGILDSELDRIASELNLQVV
jgi:hypothetical protein